MSTEYNPFENDPVVTANLTEAQARALLCIIEVGVKEIRARLDGGKYQHACQKEAARAVLTQGDEFYAGIMRVLTGRTSERLQ